MNVCNETTSLLDDTRGATMVEGAIVMPLFIIVLAAVIHLQRSYGAKLDASIQARSCAWAYSIAGCTGRRSLPKECNVDGLNDGSKGLQSIGSAVGMSSPTGTSGENSAASGAVSGANRVGLALLGLHEGIASKPTRSVSVPSILGGGKRTISGDYSVMCNEREMTSFELAKYAYCSFGDLPGCSGI